MERNYSKSTMEFVANLHVGIRVETGVLAATSYLLTGPTQSEMFNVYGRIKILQLFMEAITVLGDQATVMKFTFDSNTPALAVQNLSGVGGALNLLAQGLRQVHIGGAVVSTPVLTATAGISDILCVAPQIVGCVGGVGTIGINTATASMTSGTVQFVLCYAPMSDGAYAEAIH